MKATGIEQDRFEPTVFGAMRRYRAMVLLIAVLTAAAAVGYSLVQPEIYRSYATVTVPQSSLDQDESRDQYFDSQVLLLQSQEVADRAARIANAALNENVLSMRDFAGEGKSLEITPPEGSTPGGFGSSIVALTFTWPNSRVAQTAVNAVLQAFDDVRSADIAAQGTDDVAAVERTIRDARAKGQLADLLNQRTQTLVNLQLALANHPTVAWATEPQVPINGNSKRSGAIGLLAGLVLGAALAYWRASRRRCVDDRSDPLAIYDVPLMGEIPSAERKGIRSGLSAAADPLPMAADPQSPAAEAFRFAAAAVERIHATRDDRLAVVFVSAGTGAERSAVVANIALAVAESGTPVLAVDADATGGLTALLLPGSPQADGFEQVVAGRRSVLDCIELSPLNPDVTVLRAGPARVKRTTGQAYAESVEKIIAEAKASFDLVLIDSPALLSVANAVELVQDADASVVVLGPGESVQDHVTMVERLDRVESDLAGYLYRQTSPGPRVLRRLRVRFAAQVARRTNPENVPSAKQFAYRPAKDRRSSARVPQG
ncbi:Mrp family chromosome partitioning ATPase [Kribbella steppae]|uniref:Mrp family chromosome partitioning ATPase n=1 Tax=Kribbella steppae TaxID=2512223 RepID=A0A4R2HAU0_9ACTN|nr:Wzz/FepE/Etk N-terminal domain-containing protein [Kribbella steppae]TCO23374.1 Mrp family chromosome partitioning ATPase [Kribbella steppae]